MPSMRVGDILEPVHHLFQLVVDLARGDEGQRRIRPGLAEQRVDAGIVDVIGLALDLADLLAEQVDPAGIAG